MIIFMSPAFLVSRSIHACTHQTPKEPPLLPALQKLLAKGGDVELMSYYQAMWKVPHREAGCKDFSGETLLKLNSEGADGVEQSRQKIPGRGRSTCQAQSGGRAGKALRALREVWRSMSQGRSWRRGGEVTHRQDVMASLRESESDWSLSRGVQVENGQTGFSQRDFKEWNRCSGHL